MRIAVNTRFLLPNRLEGFGWYTHEIMRRMVQLHPEDAFLFLFDRPFDAGYIYGPNVTAQVLFPPARHPFLFYMWFEGSVSRALKAWKADVFFSPDSFLSLSTDVPTLLTIHDVVPLQMPEQIPWLQRQYYLYFLPKFAQKASKIATVSNYTKDSIVETIGIAKEKIQVVYNGCRSEFLPLEKQQIEDVRQQWSEGKSYFFYTGSIHPRKNIHRLIQAFDRFKKKTGAPVLLLLGGRFMWQKGAVQEAYDAAEYKADIRFLGYVPEAELTQIMAAALALVYVSLSEGFGLPIIEAMNCGVPVLTSNTTAMPEIAGNAALLCDPFSENDIAAHLQRLYEDAGLRQTLIEAGAEQRKQFSWDTAAEEMYALLLSLSKKNSAIGPIK